MYEAGGAVTLLTASNSAEPPAAHQLGSRVWKSPFSSSRVCPLSFLLSANEIRQRKRKTGRGWSQVGCVTTAEVGCFVQGKRDTRLESIWNDAK